MKKVILLLIYILLITTPYVCRAQVETNIKSAPTEIIVKGTNILICNAEGHKMEVFSLTGNLVATFKIETNVQSIHLPLKKGCYILKANNLVRKIFIY